MARDLVLDSLSLCYFFWENLPVLETPENLKLCRFSCTCSMQMKITAALKLFCIYAERLDLLADIQQARKWKAEHSCFTYERLCVAFPALPVLHHAFRYGLRSYSMYCSITVLRKDCKPNWVFGCYGDGGHSLAFILDDSDKSFTPYASKLCLLPEE